MRSSVISPTESNGPGAHLFYTVIRKARVPLSDNDDVTGNDFGYCSFLGCGYPISPRDISGFSASHGHGLSRATLAQLRSKVETKSGFGANSRARLRGSVRVDLVPQVAVRDILDLRPVYAGRRRKVWVYANASAALEHAGEDLRERERAGGFRGCEWGCAPRHSQCALLGLLKF